MPMSTTVNFESIFDINLLFSNLAVPPNFRFYTPPMISIYRNGYGSNGMLFKSP